MVSGEGTALSESLGLCLVFMNNRTGANHYQWAGGVRSLTCVDDVRNLPKENQEAMKAWFLRSSIKSGECRIWLKNRDRDGYGLVNISKTTVYAHRLSYALHIGEVGYNHVLHKCDNPQCVNPEHLFLGTHTDNMRDASAKGRLQSRPLRIGTNAANYKHGRYCRGNGN
jgi:hypothetical protein